MDIISNVTYLISHKDQNQFNTKQTNKQTEDGNLIDIYKNSVLKTIKDYNINISEKEINKLKSSISKEFAVFSKNKIVQKKLHDHLCTEIFRSPNHSANNLNELIKKQAKVVAINTKIVAIHTIEDSFRNFSQQKKKSAHLQRLNTVVKRHGRTDEKKLIERKVASTQDFQEIIQKLNHWSVINKEMIHATDNEKEKKLIHQNDRINLLIVDALKMLKQEWKNAKKYILRVVQDTEGHLQASMLCKIDEERFNPETNKKVSIPLYIDYISTAPWNLRVDSAKNDKRRLEGAATALIESAIYESINRGYRGAIALEAVPLAEGFYEKLGFVKKTWKPSGLCLIPMELSVDNAKKFLASIRAGRALPNM